MVIAGCCSVSRGNVAKANRQRETAIARAAQGGTEVYDAGVDGGLNTNSVESIASSNVPAGQKPTTLDRQHRGIEALIPTTLSRPPGQKQTDEPGSDPKQGSH